MENIAKLRETGAPVIDVRTKTEFWLGHAEDTINIPLNELNSRINELKEMQKPLLLCCRSGMRSGTAAAMLSDQGIECYNIGSWKTLKK